MTLTSNPLRMDSLGSRTRRKSKQRRTKSSGRSPGPPADRDPIYAASPREGTRSGRRGREPRRSAIRSPRSCIGPRCPPSPGKVPGAMATVELEDATLHVEVDGEGEPVTVLAHGLTNTCRELAAFTPLIPGTKVRFDFRGHGRSTAPVTGYRFADFARDLDAVAEAHDATAAVGTSLGAGAICHLVAREPDRFRRLVLLLPAALDGQFTHRERLLKAAETIEGAPPKEEIDAVLSDPERVASYLQAPWREQVDREMWQHEHPAGIARAIREIVDDRAVDDREELRAVTVPTL